eukprot:3941454-Rhodomonas_salina.1
MEKVQELRASVSGLAAASPSSPTLAQCSLSLAIKASSAYVGSRSCDLLVSDGCREPPAFAPV